jgi:hypothetical protein
MIEFRLGSRPTCIQQPQCHRRSSPIRLTTGLSTISRTFPSVRGSLLAKRASWGPSKHTPTLGDAPAGSDTSASGSRTPSVSTYSPRCYLHSTTTWTTAITRTSDGGRAPPICNRSGSHRDDASSSPWDGRHTSGDTTISWHSNPRYSAVLYRHAATSSYCQCANLLHGGPPSYANLLHGGPPRYANPLHSFSRRPGIPWPPSPSDLANSAHTGAHTGNSSKWSSNSPQTSPENMERGIC